MFLNLAHRGASAYAPENTLAAFYKGVEQGANGIETDLKMTRDGVVILFHDAVLDRTTNGTGEPGAHTWEELRQLDAGAWFSPRYRGEKLVSFEQFLYAFGAKDLVFACELKDRQIEDSMLALIDRYQAAEKTVVTSFHYEDLVETRRRNRRIKLGYLVEQVNDETLRMVQDIDARQICPRVETLQPEEVKRAKERGLEVRGWGAATEPLMNYALYCGVDGMTINFPDKLADARQRIRDISHL